MKERNESIINFLKKSVIPVGATVKRLSRENFSEHDDLFFKLKFESHGELSTAVIQFMPNKVNQDEMKDGEKPVHILQIFQHFFRMKNGQFFVETCPMTIGKKCPVCDTISPLYESDNDEYYRQAKNKIYFTNILVLKNPMEIEKEKKIFLFRLYKSIYDMVMKRIPSNDNLLGKMNEKTGEYFFNPFDPFQSCLFRLKGFQESKKIGVKNKDVINYTGSSFIEKLNSFGDDVVEKLYEKCYNLESILKWDEYKIKEYQELKEIYMNGMSGNFSLNLGKKSEIYNTGSIESEVDDIVKDAKFDDEQLKNAVNTENIEMDEGESNNDDIDIDVDILSGGKGDDNDDINIDEYLEKI